MSELKVVDVGESCNINSPSPTSNQLVADVAGSRNIGEPLCPAKAVSQDTSDLAVNGPDTTDLREQVARIIAKIADFEFHSGRGESMRDADDSAWEMSLDDADRILALVAMGSPITEHVQRLKAERDAALARLAAITGDKAVEAACLIWSNYSHNGENSKHLVDLNREACRSASLLLLPVLRGQKTNNPLGDAYSLV